MPRGFGPLDAQDLAALGVTIPKGAKIDPGPVQAPQDIEYIERQAMLAAIMRADVETVRAGLIKHNQATRDITDGDVLAIIHRTRLALPQVPYAAKQESREFLQSRGIKL